MRFQLIFATLISAAFAGTPWIGEPKLDAGWQNKHNAFVQNTLNNNGSVRVLFYGDSITEAWNTVGRATYNEYYAPLGTANYGISGDRTEHTLWRMQNGEVTDKLSPKVCVIKIGTNNLGSNDDTSIALGAVFNVLELRERLPNMKVLVLGVLPRNNEERTNRTIVINDVLKGLDNGKTIRYLDLKDHFYRGSGQFYEELYEADLLHLSAAGYRKWAEVMNPLFQEMLSS